MPTDPADDTLTWKEMMSYIHCKRDCWWVEFETGREKNTENKC